MRRIVLRHRQVFGRLVLELMLGMSNRQRASVQEGEPTQASAKPWGSISGMQYPPKLPISKLLIGIAVSLLACGAFANDPQEEERWNAYGQATYIWHQKQPFAAAYTNLNGSPNSLLPDRERSFTGTATAFLGLRAWKGGEIYFVPEVISQKPFSELHGLGGSIQNGELEKNGLPTPTLYRSRLFLRQTWGLGGESTPLESGPMQLAKLVDSRRFVLTAGNTPSSIYSIRTPMPGMCVSNS